MHSECGEGRLVAAAGRDGGNAKRAARPAGSGWRNARNDRCEVLGQGNTRGRATAREHANGAVMRPEYRSAARRRVPLRGGARGLLPRRRVVERDEPDSERDDHRGPGEVDGPAREGVAALPPAARKARRCGVSPCSWQEPEESPPGMAVTVRLRLLATPLRVRLILGCGQLSCATGWPGSVASVVCGAPLLFSVARCCQTLRDGVAILQVNTSRRHRVRQTRPVEERALAERREANLIVTGMRSRWRGLHGCRLTFRSRNRTPNRFHSIDLTDRLPGGRRRGVAKQAPCAAWLVCRGKDSSIARASSCEGAAPSVASLPQSRELLRNTTYPMGKLCRERQKRVMARRQARR